MRNIHFRFPVALLLGSLAFPFTSLYADETPYNIPINNYSFEDPVTFVGAAYGSSVKNYALGVPEWTLQQGLAGVLAPQPGEFPAGYDGSQIAWLNNDSSISQILGTGLADYTTYTLSALVGYYSGLTTTGYTDYSISLWAGATELASVVPVSLSDSQWNDVTATFTTGGVIPSDELGFLQVVIANAGLTQLDVDDVTLTAVDPPPVPDEGNVTWIAVIAIAACVYMNRRALGKSDTLPVIR
jgi:hypothetical protein